MPIIKKMTLKDTNNQDVVYDIGAKAENVSYDNSSNVKTKIDQKINSEGGSLAQAVAGSINGKTNSSNILTTDTAADIWGKINALRAEKNSHISDLINTSAGVHGIRYYNDQLQYYNNTEWETIKTGGDLDIIVGDVQGATATGASFIWSDPEDIVLGGTKIATWAGTVLVRKEGSAPTSRTDGTQILINNVRNQYSTGAYSDRTTQENKIYYYRFFTLTQEKMDDPNYNGDAGTTLIVNTSFAMDSWAQSCGKNTMQRVLDAYYNNEISIDYIKSYWHVGDVAEITLNPIYTTGTANGFTWSVDESHHKQKLDVVILGFEQDELVTPINGHTKAMMSVQILNVLTSGNEKPSASSTNYMNLDSELGKPHGSGDIGDDPNYLVWHDTQRRYWCNGGFYDSISEVYVRDAIKPVKKKYFTYESDPNNPANDYIWLLSVSEIFGPSAAKRNSDNEQYEYYKTNISTRILKYPKWSESFSSCPWWTRDVGYNSNGGMAILPWHSPAYDSTADYAYGLSPGWAM